MKLILELDVETNEQAEAVEALFNSIRLIKHSDLGGSLLIEK